MCVAFAGCPLSKVTDDGAVPVFPLDGVCGASGWNRRVASRYCTGHMDKLRGARACAQLTLRYLSGQRGGDGDKVQVPAAIVDGHLSALPEVVGVGVALGHEQIQGKSSVHQDSCDKERSPQLATRKTWSAQPKGKWQTPPQKKNRKKKLQHTITVNIQTDAISKQTQNKSKKLSIKIYF